MLPPGSHASFTVSPPSRRERTLLVVVGQPSAQHPSEGTPTRIPPELRLAWFLLGSHRVLPFNNHEEVQQRFNVSSV